MSDNDLDGLLAALDATGADAATTVTSLRQPVPLREALRRAVAMGMAPSVNDATNQAVRAQLEAFAARAALDAHYERNPGTRPSLAAAALALVELDHCALADAPGLVAAAAQEVLAVKPDADADDVLLWAASIRQCTAGYAGAAEADASNPARAST